MDADVVGMFPWQVQFVYSQLLLMSLMSFELFLCVRRLFCLMMELVNLISTISFVEELWCQRNTSSQLLIVPMGQLLETFLLVSEQLSLVPTQEPQLFIMRLKMSFMMVMTQLIPTNLIMI